MKYLKRILVALLALCLLTCTVACNKDVEQETSENVTEASTEKFDYAATVPDKDYGGAEFRILCTLETAQFFDDGTKNPELIHKAIEGMKELSESDLLMVLSSINRLK